MSYSKLDWLFRVALAVMIVIVCIVIAKAAYQVGFERGGSGVPLVKKEYIDRMVPVEVVKEIEVPVPGKPQIVERIVYKDPEPVEITEDDFDPGAGLYIINRDDCIAGSTLEWDDDDSGWRCTHEIDGDATTWPVDPGAVYIAEPTLMKGRVSFGLEKQVARTDDEIVVGWAGTVVCDWSNGEEWFPLTIKTLSLEHAEDVIAQTTIKNDVLTRQQPNWRVDVGFGAMGSDWSGMAGLHREFGSDHRWSVGLNSALSADRGGVWGVMSRRF